MTRAEGSTGVVRRRRICRRRICRRWICRRWICRGDTRRGVGEAHCPELHPAVGPAPRPLLGYARTDSGAKRLRTPAVDRRSSNYPTREGAGAVTASSPIARLPHRSREPAGPPVVASCVRHGRRTRSGIGVVRGGAAPAFPGRAWVRTNAPDITSAGLALAIGSRR